MKSYLSPNQQFILFTYLSALKPAEVYFVLFKDRSNAQEQWLGQFLLKVWWSFR